MILEINYLIIAKIWLVKILGVQLQNSTSHSIFIGFETVLVSKSGFQTLVIPLSYSLHAGFIFAGWLLKASRMLHSVRSFLNLPGN